MTYAAVKRSTGLHVVSLDSFLPQGTRKVYWFKAVKINNCLFVNGMGSCDLLARHRSGTGSLCAGKPRPSWISAYSKCLLQLKAKFMVVLTDNENASALQSASKNHHSEVFYIALI